MPPNARPFTHIVQEDHSEQLSEALLETYLNDKKIDTSSGQSSTDKTNNNEDVKHGNERKKRDRILEEGVLINLMKKSDWQGFKRLSINLSIMAITVYTINRLDVYTTLKEDGTLTLQQLLMFLPLYFFYGFQFQCFAFAGQHEFLHRNAFKTKIVNDVCLFLTGVFCFELGVHERVMHKRHHTYTNNIYNDPELTSYYSRTVLENPGFRNLPSSRYAYFKQFLNVLQTFKCRAGRIVFSSLGIPVDYSGTGWSLQNWTYSQESGIMRQLQQTAIAQLCCYATILYCFGQSRQGLQALAFWWFVPVLCGYPVVNYFRNLEHADCEVSYNDQESPNCLRNTRSVRSNFLVRLLLWDTNYHAEHHCYPMVPFYNLHKLNELMYDHVIHNEREHFTTQNWAALKANGWIDKQAVDMARHTKVVKDE